MMKARQLPTLLTTAAFLLFSGCATPPTMETPPAEVTAQPSEKVEKSSQLRIRAVGDIMLGTDFPADRLPPEDGRGLLAPVRGWLQDADLTFGNVEGVLMDGGEPEKFCNNPRLCFLFRSPARYAHTLKDAGFDVVSLANNHARDFGEAGRSASMSALARSGIETTGRVGDIASMLVDGHRVAVVAFAHNVGSWSLLDIEGAAHLVAGLEVGHDIVIVSFHGGAEGADALHVPEGMEEFYGEQRGDLRRFSRAVIEAGADLVIGHGPHVPRGLEVYRARLIAYSLGNFATHWGISVAGNNGLAPILEVTLDPTGLFVEGRILSAVQQRPDGVFPDPGQRALKLMRRLTREDFDGGQLVFDGDRLLPSPLEAVR